MPDHTPRPSFLAHARAELYGAARRIDRQIRSAEAEGPLDRERLREVVAPLLLYAELVDSCTRKHVQRVGESAEQMGLSLGWEPQQAQNLGIAAQLHDLGKIGVPEAILQKPGPLSPEERSAMELHTVLGGTLFGDCGSGVLRMARDVARCHHERWDGTGYPAGLAGEQIPVAARIVALADVYDALTHTRPYRPAIPHERALEMILQGGATHFDPELVDAFARLHREAVCA